MFLLVILALVVFAFYLFNGTVENQKPWIQGFDTLKFSSDEFYKVCEEAIKKRGIPGIRFSRVNYPEGSVMSARREYLHIVRGEDAYDICAAPYGTGFFVSSWYAEKPSLWKKILRKHPSFEGLTKTRTYYQIDTDAMFHSFIHSAMLEAIDAMTESKGFRSLTEFERRMPEKNKK